MNIIYEYIRPEMVRDLIAIIGLACIVVAAFMVAVILGFVVLGTCLIVVAFVMALAASRQKPL